MKDKELTRHLLREEARHLIERSISGYRRMIERLLNKLTTKQLQEVVDEMNGKGA